MEEAEEVETEQITTEEIVKCIEDVDEIHEQLREVYILKDKLSYSKRALSLAQKKSAEYQDLLRKADSEIYELRRSNVTLEQHNKLKKELSDLEAKNHEIVNWAEIRYQKVNQELVTQREKYDLLAKETQETQKSNKPVRRSYKPRQNKEVKIKEEVKLEESQQLADLQKILESERNEIKSLTRTLYSLQQSYDEMTVLKKDLQKQLVESGYKHQEIVDALHDQLRKKDEEIRIAVQELNIFKKDQISLPVLLEQPKKMEENKEQLRIEQTEKLDGLKRVIKLERERVKELTNKLNALKKHEQSEIKLLNNQLESKTQTIDTLNNQLRNKEAELEKAIEELTALQLQINLSKEDNTIEVENCDDFSISNDQDSFNKSCQLETDDGNTSDPPTDEIDSIFAKMRNPNILISPLPMELEEAPLILEPTQAIKNHVQVSPVKDKIMTEPIPNLRMLHLRKKQLLMLSRKLNMMKKKVTNTKRECSFQNKKMLLIKKELRMVKKQSLLAIKKLRLIKHRINLKKPNQQVFEDQSTQCSMTFIEPQELPLSNSTPTEVSMAKIKKIMILKTLAVKKAKNDPTFFKSTDGFLSYPSAESEMDYGSPLLTGRKKKFRKLKHKEVICNSTDDDIIANKNKRNLCDKGTNTDLNLNDVEVDPGNASAETIYEKIHGSVDSGYVKTDTGGETEGQNKKEEICLEAKKTPEEEPKEIKHRTRAMVKLFGFDSDAHSSCLESNNHPVISTVSNYLQRIEAERSIQSSDEDYLRGFSNGCYSSVPKKAVDVATTTSQKHRKLKQDNPCNINLMNLSTDFSATKTRNPLLDDGLESLTCKVISIKSPSVSRKTPKKIKSLIPTKMTLRSADKTNKTKTDDEKRNKQLDSKNIVRKTVVEKLEIVDCEAKGKMKSVATDVCNNIRKSLRLSAKVKKISNSETDHGNSGTARKCIATEKSVNDASCNKPSDNKSKTLKSIMGKKRVRCSSETVHKPYKANGRRNSIATGTSTIVVCNKKPSNHKCKSLTSSTETLHQNSVAISEPYKANGRRHSITTGTSTNIVSNKKSSNRKCKSLRGSTETLHQNSVAISEPYKANGRRHSITTGTSTNIVSNKKSSNRKCKSLSSSTETLHQNSVAISEPYKANGRRHSIATGISTNDVSNKKLSNRKCKSLRSSTETLHQNSVAISEPYKANGRRHSIVTGTPTIAVSNKKLSNSKCKSLTSSTESVHQNSVAVSEPYKTNGRRHSIATGTSTNAVSNKKPSTSKYKSSRSSTGQKRVRCTSETVHKNSVAVSEPYKANGRRHSIATGTSTNDVSNKKPSNSKCKSLRSSTAQKRKRCTSETVHKNSVAISKPYKANGRRHSIATGTSINDVNNKKPSNTKCKSLRSTSGQKRVRCFSETSHKNGVSKSKHSKINNRPQSVCSDVIDKCSENKINLLRSKAEKLEIPVTNNEQSENKIRSLRLCAGKYRPLRNVSSEIKASSNNIPEPKTQQALNIISNSIECLSGNIKETSPGKTNVLRKSESSDEYKPIAKKRRIGHKIEINEENNLITKEKQLIVANKLQTQQNLIETEDKQSIIICKRPKLDESSDVNNPKVKGSIAKKSEESNIKQLLEPKVILTKLVKPTINALSNEQFSVCERTAQVAVASAEIPKLSFKRPNTRRTKPAVASPAAGNSELIAIRQPLHIVTLEQTTSSESPASPILQNLECRLDFESRMSPSIYADGDNFLPVQPRIIPFTEIEDGVGRAISLTNQILHYSTSGEMAEAVTNDLLCENPYSIARLILGVVSQDIHSTIETFNYRRAPLLSIKQRLMLGLLLALEERGLKGTIGNFLYLAEQYLLNLKEPSYISPVARLHSAICKIQFNYTRMRGMLCKAAFFMDDAAIPYLYIVIGSWLELLPLNKELLSACDALKTRTLVQIIRLKRCTEPKYNLHNLRSILRSYYGYPFDQEDSGILLEDLFKAFIEMKRLTIRRDGKSESIMYLILALCKSLDKLFVFKHLDKLKVRLVVITENEEIYAIIYLVGIITSQYCSGVDVCKNVEDNKEWLQKFCADSYPEHIQNAAKDVLRKF